MLHVKHLHLPRLNLIKKMMKVPPNFVRMFYEKHLDLPRLNPFWKWWGTPKVVRMFYEKYLNLPRLNPIWKWWGHPQGCSNVPRKASSFTSIESHLKMMKVTSTLFECSTWSIFITSVESCLKNDEGIPTLFKCSTWNIFTSVMPV